ncbi:MAG: preprotein translocase subunit SecE [Dehalococcoidia bacterium]
MSPRGEGKRRFQRIRNVITELRKVSWPSRDEAARLTLIVLVITIAVALILGFIDYGFSKLIDAVLIE